MSGASLRYIGLRSCLFALCALKTGCTEHCGLAGGYLLSDAAIVMEGCIPAVACDAYVGMSDANADCIQPALTVVKGSAELCSELKEAMALCEPAPEAFEALCSKVVPLLDEVALAKMAACKHKTYESIRDCVTDRSCLLSILGPDQGGGQPPN